MPHIIILIAASVAALLLIYAWRLEPARLLVRRQDLFFPALPENWEGKSILFFSDLHAGPDYRGKRLDRLAARLLQEQPAAILFGGDLIAERSPLAKPAFQEEVRAFFARLTDQVPVYAIYGNHDREADPNRRFVDRCYLQTGVQCLTNEAVDLQGLSLYGMDEGYHGSPDLPRRDFSGLLLLHQPDLADGLAPAAAAGAYALSGHTHRGQVTFFGLPLVRVPLGRRYTYGNYSLENGWQLLVTGGVGTVHLPFRFGATPEIWRLRLKSRDGVS